MGIPVSDNGFNIRCALPRLYAMNTLDRPSVLFSNIHSFIPSNICCWGFHLYIGNPKVDSVIKLLHRIGSNAVLIPSSSVLKSPVKTHTSSLYSTLICAEPIIWPAGCRETFTPFIYTGSFQ